MLAFVLRRLAFSLVVIWLVTLIVFALIRVMPGDALIVKLGQTGRLPPDQLAAARAELGLDKTIERQYLDWTTGLLRGRFGDSLIHENRSISSAIGRSLAVTVENVLLASAVGLPLAFAMASACAINRGSWLDNASRLVAIGGITLPTFWLGIMTIVVLSRWFSYFPPAGYEYFWGDPLKNLQQHYLPVLILAFALAAPLARLLRTTLLESLNAEYVRTARAKGVQESQVLRRHVLPNSILPVVALYGDQMAALLGGSLVLEVLFNLPGMGTLTYQAVTERDYTQVEANALAFAVLAVVTSLFVDLAYAYLDPRVRFTT